MPAQFKIGEKIEIIVHRPGEPCFDRACEQAYKMALRRFGDDCGHLKNVIKSDRSRDSVVVAFRSYQHFGGMGGQSCEYIFEAWVSRDG